MAHLATRPPLRALAPPPTSSAPASARRPPWLPRAALAFAVALAAPRPPAAAAPAPVVETPLSALPYTPGLDPASMDRGIDPCVDFYAYACGGWLQKNPIPPDQAAWSVYGKLAQDNQRFLWGILEGAARPRPGRSAGEQKIGDYFASCMDEAQIERAGARPLAPVLASIERLRSTAELPSWLARQHLATGSERLAFGLSADQDFDDATRVIAFVVAGGLGLPDRDYYLKTDPRSEEIRQRYRAHVQAVLQLIGEAEAAASAHAGEILELETRLARAALSRVERRDPNNLRHPMTRAELAALTPGFSWDRYLGEAGIGEVARINVTEPGFFAELARLLASEPLARWKEYLRWHSVNARADYLSRPFVEAHFDFFRRYLRGVTQMKPRWKRCVAWVDRDLGEALGQAFVERTFRPDTRQRTLAMVKEIEAAMESDLRELPWMGEATRAQALDKLQRMVNKIGYPDRFRDYRALAIRRGDFLGNVERGLGFEARRVLAKIGKPVDRGEWLMTPPTVNAYYNAQMNDMNFPAGVLQPPLFDPRLDEAPGYGNTGSTIGHELTHGFDDEGRKFDAAGNLRDFWTPADAAEFEKRAACVVDQYAQYPVVDDLRINSKLTLGEDVADLGGTRLAYLAWRHATAGQKLPSADGLSPEQRFFVGFAQWACENERDESKRLNAVTNPHSPGRYRINGVVANLPEFASAFACRKGQPMVREPVCRIW